MPTPSDFGTSGLSAQEASKRYEEFGPNELTGWDSRNLLQVTWDALREPMVLLLLGICALYTGIGDVHEALSLLGFLILILGITIFQERKTETTLSALRRLSSPRALALRDGRRVRIPGREVVPGDVLFVNEGDRAPADIELKPGSFVQIDESILTGESVPVQKCFIAGDRVKVYSGTLVVSGQGWGEVIATGFKTQLGQIGKELQGEPSQPSPLQRQARKMVRKLGVVAGALTALVILTYGMTRGDWTGATLTGLTLAMAILPNELPAVLLIFLATGAWRISRRKVLTRKIPAVEALGGVSTLCVDKTGTLTLNQMSTQALWTRAGEINLITSPDATIPEAFHEVLEFGILACRPDAFDPMEQAIHEAGERYLSHTEHLHPEWRLSKEYPLSPELLAVSYAWRGDEVSGYRIAAKGAPEAIIDLCHLSPSERQQIETQVAGMADRGMRMLGIANARSDRLPKIQHDLDFDFVGLVGMADPVRSDARASVEECRSAGIRVLMITGDHPATARNIARQIGLGNQEYVLTGAQMDDLNDTALGERLKEVCICCRMTPSQKLRIVEILQKSGEVVAMTGDGVNDAPALRRADIGIAMGGRGTDVARESAAIVLLDDNFSSIVAAIRTGRRTYQNLQSAFSYLLAAHIPITAISILPVAFQLPIVLLPIHIAFLHLIIEPACTTVFEAEEGSSDLMRRRPRQVDSTVLDRGTLLESISQGILVAAIVMAVFAFALWRGHAPEDARALTFTVLILTNLGLILSNRPIPSEEKVSRVRTNRPLIGVLIGSVILLGAVLFYSPFRELFQFSVLHPPDIAICLAAGGLSWISLKILKVLRHRRMAVPDLSES